MSKVSNTEMWQNMFMKNSIIMKKKGRSVWVAKERQTNALQTTGKNSSSSHKTPGPGQGEQNRKTIYLTDWVSDKKQSGKLNLRRIGLSNNWWKFASQWIFAWNAQVGQTKSFTHTGMMANQCKSANKKELTVAYIRDKVEIFSIYKSKTNGFQLCSKTFFVLT